ncbi:MAG TPA: hypothetical protein PLY86_21615, partial [bacterium]|nr:hypothetical protein [bacterium]
MRTRYIPPAILCVVLVVLYCVLMTNDETPVGPVKEVQIDVESGEVAFSNGKETRTIRAGERLAAATAPVVPPSPAPIAIPTPTAPPEGVLAIRLVDALGDSIPNGIIELASQTYESAHSEFLVRDVSAGTYTLSARADGYQAATQTVEVPAERSIVVTLEYLCTFEITVLDNNKAPAAGAQVSLMEGAKVPRPPKSSLSVVGKREFAGKGVLNLRPIDGRIRIVSIEGNQPSGYWLDQQSYDLDRERPSVEINDTVVAAKTKSKDQPLPLSRLRNWDTIALLNSNPNGSTPITALYFEREVKPFQCVIFGEQETHGSTTILTSLTDETGKCRFENLSPGLYFANAAKGNERTVTYPLSPVDRSVNMPLFGQDNASVGVSVEKKDFPNRRWCYIPNTEVRLEGIDRKILMSNNTGPGGGSVRFQPLPWGRYRITVIPPESLQAEPPSREIEIQVEGPGIQVTAEFRTKGDAATAGVKVSGIVQREDTKERLADFPLELKVNCSPSTQGRATWQRYALVKTNADGEFQFEQVLPMPGGYMITSLPAKESPSMYTDCGKGLRFLDRDDPRAKPEPHFLVTTSDITGIVYSVLPAAITTLMGTVTMADGSPVPDAGLEIEGLDENLIQSDSRTDKEGGFVLSFLLPLSEKPVETALHAILKAEPISKMMFNPEGDPEYSYEDAGLAAESNTPVKFRVGDTIRDIPIVLKQMEKGYVLYGKMLTEDGGTPEHPQAVVLQVSQEQKDPIHKELVHFDRVALTARVEPNGTYRVEGLQPGPFRLNISSLNPFIAGTPERITFPLRVSYQSMDVQLEMAPDVKEMRYDVVLKKNSYFHGRVLDENLKPPSI